MKIVKAMKKIARLQGEVKELKKRIASSLNTFEENIFPEKLEDLMKMLDEKTQQIIDLKVKKMKENIKANKFQIVLQAGELKSRIEFLRELEPKSGFQETRYGESKEKMKSQMTIAQKNKLVQECQEQINTLTDELDAFNSVTEISE